MDSWDTLHAFSDEMEKIAGLAATLGGAGIGALLGAAGGATAAGEGQRAKGALLGALGGAGIGAIGGRMGGKALGDYSKTMGRIGESEFKIRGALPQFTPPKKSIMDRILMRSPKVPAGQPAGEFTPIFGPQAKALRKVHGMREASQSGIRQKMLGIGAVGGVGAVGAGRVAGGMVGPQQEYYQPPGR